MILSTKSSLDERVTSFGVLGKGNFGGFLEARLGTRYNVPVRSFDPNRNSCHSEESVLSSSVIFLCVPPLAMEDTVRSVAPFVRSSGGILVDVCSVKMHTVRIFEQVAHDIPCLFTHPLFGPQSFEDNSRLFDNLELAICGHRHLESHYSDFVTFFREWGLNVVKMTPEEHDRGPSIEQLIVQFQGLLHHRAGFMLNGHQIHTRSAKYYYQAMNIVRDDEALFHQIAELNPFWPEAKAKLLAEYRKEIERMAA